MDPRSSNIKRQSLQLTQLQLSQRNACNCNKEALISRVKTNSPDPDSPTPVPELEKRSEFPTYWWPRQYPVATRTQNSVNFHQLLHHKQSMIQDIWSSVPYQKILTGMVGLALRWWRRGFAAGVIWGQLCLLYSVQILSERSGWTNLTGEVNIFDISGAMRINIYTWFCMNKSAAIINLEFSDTHLGLLISWNSFSPGAL